MDGSGTGAEAVGASVGCYGSGAAQAAVGATEDSEFDWLMDFDAVRAPLRAALSSAGLGGAPGEPPQGLCALVLGCGTSALSARLLDDGLCSRVVSLDREAHCIRFMKHKYRGDVRLQWAEADIDCVDSVRAALAGVEAAASSDADADAESDAEAAAEASGEPFTRGVRFDLVVDKATLDALLCEGQGAGYFATVCEALKHTRAVFAIVSLHDAEFMRRLFTFDFGRRFDLSVQQLERPDRATPSFLTLTAGDPSAVVGKGGSGGDGDGGGSCDGADGTRVGLDDDAAQQKYAALFDQGALQAHIDSVLQWQLTEATPMLSREREADVRERFAAGSLALGDAYTAIFTDEERQMYEWNDFVEDARASQGERQAPAAMTADEAVHFLQSNQ